LNYLIPIDAGFKQPLLLLIPSKHCHFRPKLMIKPLLKRRLSGEV